MMATKIYKLIQVFRLLPVMELSLPVQNGVHFEIYMTRSPAAYLAMAPYEILFSTKKSIYAPNLVLVTKREQF